MNDVEKAIEGYIRLARGLGAKLTDKDVMAIQAAFLAGFDAGGRVLYTRLLAANIQASVPIAKQLKAEIEAVGHALEARIFGDPGLN